jgi:hypothetical protein
MLVFVLYLAFTVLTGTVMGKNRVMTWLCLEFCEESSTEINIDLYEIDKHRDTLTAVSFEKYTLGSNGTLLDNHLTSVSDRIIAMGLEPWPLLSSFPHVPEFIDFMRDVFTHPQSFIDQCVREAKKYGYVGYNLDWEPTEDCTEQDGLDYAAFIDTFAKELHTQGLQLSVDYASWSPIWNLPAIADSAADAIISMSTYTSTDSAFQSSLDKLVSTVDLQRAGVGLQTVNASDGSRLSLDEVKWRFDLIKEAGVKSIALWRSPVPPGWWPLLDEFARPKPEF